MRWEVVSCFLLSPSTIGLVLWLRFWFGPQIVPRHRRCFSCCCERVGNDVEGRVRDLILEASEAYVILSC